MMASDPDGDMSLAIINPEMRSKIDYRQFNSHKGVFTKRINVHRFLSKKSPNAAGW